MFVLNSVTSNKRILFNPFCLPKFNMIIIWHPQRDVKAPTEPVVPTLLIVQCAAKLDIDTATPHLYSYQRLSNCHLLFEAKRCHSFFTQACDCFWVELIRLNCTEKTKWMRADKSSRLRDARRLSVTDYRVQSLVG